MPEPTISRRVVDLEAVLALVERYGAGPDLQRALADLGTQPSRSSDPTWLDGAPPSEGTLPPPAVDDVTEPSPRIDRYEDLGLLGVGGMGEVRRVLDRELERVVAMKIMRPELVRHAGARARFVEEARTTAQLAHPGVVGVHDLGRTRDDRPYFTMDEIRGRTLHQAMRKVHKASREGRWEPAEGFSFRRLVDVFHRVCETMSSAHARGVVHRDLKPENVMVGPYGEVLVVDWGVAQVPRASADGERPPGGVAGTPAYMSPEQARGERVGPAADVYALGAILFQLLTGAPPHGVRADSLSAVLDGPPRPAAEAWETSNLPPVPEDLLAIADRALARDPADRYPDASALAHDVARWLEGARQRERALGIVDDALALEPRIAEQRARAASLRAQAREKLADVVPYAPVADKREGWALEDEAARLVREADLAELRMTMLLSGALSHAPDLREAHAALADHWRAKQREAEEGGDASAAARAEALLRAHDNDGRHAAWLEGTGTLTLVTDPPGATVTLYRYVERDRYLEEELVRVLGTTPLREVPLPMGSWLCVLEAPGRATVRYPVHIARAGRWDDVPVPLPSAGELGPDDVYVPAGSFIVGDRAGGNTFRRQRTRIDGFVMRRYPVTQGEYKAFLDDLVASGREAEALAWVPRERGPGVGGAMIYGRDDQGRFTFVPDAEGDVYQPDWPAFMMTWDGARAYAAWEAERTGLPWRLPRELEWEKAARGVDGRMMPWGETFDATFANTRYSRPGRPLVDAVTSFPRDVSPYGVRGLGGNVKEWTLDAWQSERATFLPPDEPVVDRVLPRITRGGCWFTSTATATSRYYTDQTARNYDVGFRLVRPWRRG